LVLQLILVSLCYNKVASQTGEMLRS